MARLLSLLLVSGTMGLVANPLPADAQGRQADCVTEAVESCDDDFPGESWINIGIRGWCYTIRTGMCLIGQQLDWSEAKAEATNTTK